MTKPEPYEQHYHADTVQIQEQHEKDLITVCDHCFCASCWQGVILCSGARDAGTIKKTREELKVLDREHSSYWKTDKELAG